MRRDTKTWRRMSHQHSVWRSEILSPLVSAYYVYDQLRLSVTLGQCRPLSKTVRFNVLRVAKNKAAAKSFGKF